MASRPPHAERGAEVENLVADLFGDFSDSEQGSQKSGSSRGVAGAAAESPKRPPPQSSAASSEDGEAGKRPKKRQKKEASKYFETEAVEAGAGSDEEEDDLEDLIDDAGADGSGDKARNKREVLELQAEMRKRDAAGTSVRSSGFLDKLEEKYKREGESQDPGISLDDIGRSVPSSEAKKARMSQETTFIVPDTAKDPRLWCVKTFAPERELCLSLLLKSGGYLSAGKECPIFSAFYNPALRGYIYLEAHKENDIRAFSKGIRGISPWQIRLVPVAQMPQVFSSAVLEADKKDQVKVGEWVRMKRGLYQGDLASIEEIQDQEYTVRLKPRLDYSGASAAPTKKGRTREPDILESKEARKETRNAKRIPPARWFNRADVEAAGLIISSSRERRFTSKGYLSFFKVEDEVYRDGFLYKKFKTHLVLTGEKVRPSEHELQDWRNVPPPSSMTTPDMDTIKKAEHEEEHDRKMMPPPAVPSGKQAIQQKMPLCVDDIVIVSHGDLMNMCGVVTRADAGEPTVYVRPTTKGIKDGEIQIAVERLGKYFEVGDHVKAHCGENSGNSGFITQVNLRDTEPKWGFGATATVVANIESSAASHWKCLLNHIRISVEKAAPQEAVGEFHVGDIVKFGIGSIAVGLIVRVEAGKRAVILDSNGQNQVAKFGELVPISSTGKGSGREGAAPVMMGAKKSFWALDRKGRRITIGSVVQAAARTVPGGIKAEVLWIHDNNLFIRASEVLVGEKAFMVVPGKSCLFTWCKSNDVEQEIIDRRKELEDERIKAQQEEAEDGAFATNIQMASTMSFKEKLLSKAVGGKNKKNVAQYEKGEAVRINGGSYKGLRGEIREDLGANVLISLLSKPKLVQIPVINVARDEYTGRGEKTWLQNLDEKEVRNANAGELYETAPGTPPAMDIDDTPKPAAVPSSDAESDDDKDIMNLASKGIFAGDAREWDPNYGLEEVKSKTPAPTGAPADSEDNISVAPSDDEAPPEAGFMDNSAGLSLSLADFCGEDPDDDGKWIIPGVGVKYDDDGTEEFGWVYKVSGSTVNVVPNKGNPVAGSVPLSAMRVRKEADLAPTDTFKIGDTVAVIHGTDRNTRGTIVSEVGMNSVNIKTAKDDAMEVSKEDIALFSIAWEKASVGLPQDSDAESMDVDDISAAVAAAPPTPDAGEPWPEDTPDWAQGGAVETPISQVGAQTPAHTVGSVTPQVSGTPQTVSDATPQSAMAVDTPMTLKGETPAGRSDVGSSGSAFSETPESAASTPQPLRTLASRLQRGRGRVSRLPVATTPQHLLAGNVTPASSVGETPMSQSGAVTPMPGGVTPMLPVPGAVTPMSGGGETPITPLSRTTPLVAAVPGQLTPMPGVTTPNLKKVETSPSMAGGTPSATPAASSQGAVTPEIKSDDKA